MNASYSFAVLLVLFSAFFSLGQSPKPSVKKPVPELPQVLPSESAIAFNAKVQPVLMNKCANCHAQKSYTGTFKLERIAEGFANPEATAANATIALEQLNRENPLQSALLTYAITAHGGQKLPSFAHRDQASFQNIEHWVRASVPTVKATAVAEPKPLPAAIVKVSSPPVVVPSDPFDPKKFNSLPVKK